MCTAVQCSATHCDMWVSSLTTGLITVQFPLQAFSEAKEVLKISKYS